MDKKNLFTIGELADYQNISRQTLIFYDKTGLFKPACVDPKNGYRYYSAGQLDDLNHEKDRVFPGRNPGVHGKLES